MQPPGAIKVFGVLNVVFAGLGLFALSLLAMLYFGVQELGWLDADELDAILSSDSYMSYLKVSLVIGGIATLVLLASGIGLLKQRAWGRTLAIGYAIYGILDAIVELAVTQQLVGEIDPFDTVRGAAYPIVLLVFMLRGNVRDWFTGQRYGSG